MSWQAALLVLAAAGVGVALKQRSLKNCQPSDEFVHTSYLHRVRVRLTLVDKESGARVAAAEVFAADVRQHFVPHDWMESFRASLRGEPVSGGGYSRTDHEGRAEVFLITSSSEIHNGPPGGASLFPASRPEVEAVRIRLASGALQDLSLSQSVWHFDEGTLEWRLDLGTVAIRQ